MVNGYPDAVNRVVAAADAAGLPIEVRIMPASTRTAEHAAAACGCDVAQIVKSLIFTGKTSGRPYLLLVSGKNRVNEKAVAGRLGEEIVRPDADFVRTATGFAIGGIPPLGHDRALVTIIDEDLRRHPSIWAAAGHPNAVFPLTPDELERMTGGTVARTA